MDVHLVDGTFELFRCFHGAPRATNADGREVGAARAFLWTMLKLIRKDGATHVAVAFDGMAGRVRTGSGASDTELIRTQYLPALDAARALGLVVWPMTRFQADDALATAADRLGADPAVDRIVICTTDKDLLQCVRGERIVLLDRIHKRLTDEAALRDRFGISPAAIPDYHALVGDPSDGLPGIPRWGPKATRLLLDRYGSVESIPDSADTWDVEVRGADALARSLHDRRREAILMRDLSRLRTDLPIRDTATDLEWRGARRAELDLAVEQLEADGILERIPRWHS